MLKNLPLILLIQVAYATKVNIANCNELWGMTNTMNKQPLYSEDGGSMSENKILEIIDSNDEDRNEKMRFLYRKFTDQLMENLKQLGAP